MADNAKASILDRVRQEGHTASYGTLLHLVALMGPSPIALKPQTDEELIKWVGHFEGLRAALHCLVMHERNIDPEAAALVVRSHIKDAIDDLNHNGDAGTGR